MRHYLVVANESLDDPALDEWIGRRLATGPVHIHLVVPPNRTEGRIHWHEEEAEERARRRLARARHRLRALGALVAGEIGPEDPLLAVATALRARPYDVTVLAA